MTVSKNLDGDGAAKRAPVGKRLRFDVFKRDKFTCQYCGAKAPDVLLQCDHIRPVADGGDSDILNLITSCQPCNGGKGAVPLSDAATLDKQRDMLADIEERRQQIDMMLAWRDELRGLANHTVEAVVQRVQERGGNVTVSATGRANIKKWLAKFELQEVLEAVDCAFDQYAEYDGELMTHESWERAFSKVGGIARIKKAEEDRPWLGRLFYIQAIIRNRTGAQVEIDYLEHLYLHGALLDDIQLDAKKRTHVTHFMRAWDNWLESLGKPYPGGRGWA